MQGEIERDRWQAYLDDFSKRNRGRATRVDMIGEEIGVQGEARRLPLEGVSFEGKGSVAPAVEIMLSGSGAADTRALTHTITRPRRIASKIGADGREEALEIEAGDGTKAILVFEALPELPETTS